MLSRVLPFKDVDEEEERDNRGGVKGTPSRVANASYLGLKD